MDLVPRRVSLRTGPPLPRYAQSLDATKPSINRLELKQRLEQVTEALQTQSLSLVITHLPSSRLLLSIFGRL